MQCTILEHFIMYMYFFKVHFVLDILVMGCLLDILSSLLSQLQSDSEADPDGG